MANRSALVKYAWNSKIMDIRISYGDELIKFNLNSETLIDENRINEEIKEQPSVYGFLGMLLVKLERIKDDKEREKDKSYASMFIKFKSEIDELSGRPTANELAKEKATASLEFQKASKAFIKAKENYGTIKYCVESFQQRHLLIQTLSANIRKG